MRPPKSDVFADSSKARIHITKQQQKEIRKMYQDLSDEISKEIEQISTRTNVSSVLRTQYLQGLQKEIEAELRKMNGQTDRIIKKNMGSIASAVTEDTRKFLGSVGIDASSMYYHVPTDIVKEVASGNLYKGRWTLSDSIWKTTKKNLNDIDNIVAKGIAGQKSTYEIAKDLEKYVNPAAKKAWEWSKVYPGTSRVVDYNAQRLARTMVSHAYQDSILRTTKDIPFVECYEWMTAGGDRVCEICQERESGFHGVVINGKNMHGCYYADDLPLDHPNGMCVIDVYVEKDYDAIADRLADWVNGETDPELDNFARSLGYSSSTLKSKVRVE